MNAVLPIEPTAEVLPDDLSQLVFMVDHTNVAKGRHDNHIFHIITMHIQHRRIARFSVSEKISLFGLLDDKHIIVKVYKLFRQFFNPVQIQFYCMAAESWQILFRYEVSVIDYVELWVFCIQPFGICPHVTK